MKAIAFLLSLILGVLLAGCTGAETVRIQDVPTEVASATAIPTAGMPEVTIEPTVDALATPQAALMQLTQADSFRIEDDWTGLSPIAPVNAHYDLRRRGTNFIGKANFSVAGYIKERTAVEDVSIPEAVALEFFRTLSQSPVELSRYKRGDGPEYEPRIDHTDDYPSINIQVDFKTESVRFFTTSQGENHIPWGLDLRGNIFIIDSAQPMKALEVLAPYLKKDTLEKLINDAYEGDVGMPTTGAQDPQP